MTFWPGKHLWSLDHLLTCEQGGKSGGKGKSSGKSTGKSRGKSVVSKTQGHQTPWVIESSRVDVRFDDPQDKNRWSRSVWSISAKNRIWVDSSVAKNPVLASPFFVRKWFFEGKCHWESWRQTQAFENMPPTTYWRLCSRFKSPLWNMEILRISRHFCNLSTLWIGPRLREDIDIFKFPVAPRQGLRLPTRRFEDGVRLRFCAAFAHWKDSMLTFGIEHDICWNLTWHVYHSRRHLHPYLHLCTSVQVRTFLLYMNTHFFSFLYECTRMSEYWGFGWSYA